MMLYTIYLTLDGVPLADVWSGPVDIAKAKDEVYSYLREKFPYEEMSIFALVKGSHIEKTEFIVEDTQVKPTADFLDNEDWEFNEEEEDFDKELHCDIL